MDISIDVNWIDGVSALGGVIYTYVKAWKANLHREIFYNQQFGNIFAVGCTIFPMVLLMASFFASGLLIELAKSSRLTIAVSGAFALSTLLDSNSKILESVAIKTNK